MTPLRVAYFVNVFPKLSETFIAYELSELRRRGVELLVLSLRQPSEALQHDIIRRAGLHSLVCYEPDRFPEAIRAFRPDLIHAHFATEPAAAARDYAHALGVPFTFTAHGYDIRRKAPPDLAERATAARAVITVSHANADHITNTFGVPKNHLRVIPCGVDAETFRPVQNHRSPNEPPLIVCVARHVKVKNLGFLLQACAALKNRAVHFRCVSVGDGVCRAELEEMHTQFGLGKAFEFAGAQEHGQILAWWQRADIAVLTSENEGMPVSLMEAGACAIPAVAPAVGGIPELVQHEVTGLLTPPGDLDAFSGALQQLIGDPSRRIAMGRAARAWIEQRFSLVRQVDSLLAVWSEVLQ